MNLAYCLSANCSKAPYDFASNIVCVALPKRRYSLAFLPLAVSRREEDNTLPTCKCRPFSQKLCLSVFIPKESAV